ncbi:hypothetical protein E3U43_007276 [Larimichthys crocea]|uniref:Uncharacterized protein n=1 Tax=Larimichthys crocea TaxID=215358 RepID=A0ACD3RQ92_LARCR|nr:hypothetical protein E3U43_007276 [Larimichthys crocea]
MSSSSTPPPHYVQEDRLCAYLSPLSFPSHTDYYPCLPPHSSCQNFQSPPTPHFPILFAQSRRRYNLIGDTLHQTLHHPASCPNFSPYRFTALSRLPFLKREVACGDALISSVNNHELDSRALVSSSCW